MSDDRHNVLDGLLGSEAVLDARLQRAGATMRRQDLALAELDPAFAQALRGRLLTLEAPRPDPTFARTLRARLVGSGARPVARPRSRPGVAARALGLAAFAVAAAFGITHQLHPGSTSTFAAHVPIPSAQDLTFGFPGPAISTRSIAPTQSLIHPSAGTTFQGHLHIVVSALRSLGSQAHAYRLRPAHRIAEPALTFDIHAPLRRVVHSGQTWLVAAQGGGTSSRPLHSIAVSLTTGETIYHDRRNSILRAARHPLDRPQAIAAARHWLSRLGWPGRLMPLQAVTIVPGMPHARQIAFGWAGAGPSAISAATLWVVPDGSVIEAWVWPPIEQTGSVPTRALRLAAEAVRRGRAPLAVLGVSPTANLGGRAVVRRSRIVTVLSRGRDGWVYLVPVYRFDGIATVGARAATHPWYALTPAM